MFLRFSREINKFKFIYFSRETQKHSIAALIEIRVDLGNRSLINKISRESERLDARNITFFFVTVFPVTFLFKYLNELFNICVGLPKRNINVNFHANPNGYTRETSKYKNILFFVTVFPRYFFLI